MLLSSLVSLSKIQDILINYWPLLKAGIITTLEISLLGTLIGFGIGLVVGGIKAIDLDRQSSKLTKIIKKVYNIVASIYIEGFRGTPMMVQALFIYYAFLNFFNWTPNACGLVVISINTGAYMSEIIRSGIQSVDKGQTEAARSLGMSNMQTMFFVVIPQAIKNAFPAIGNEFVVNIKDSSVLSIITVTDLMYKVNRTAGATFDYPNAYLLAAILYLCLTLPVSFLLRKIEHTLNHKNSSFPKSDTTPETIDLTNN